MWCFAALIDLLFPLRDTAKRVRTCSHEELGRLLTPHVTNDGIITLLPYRHPLVRAVILEAKFHKNERAFALLGDIAEDYLSALEEESEAFEARRYVLIPIPLSTERMRERGYNQTEEIARQTKRPVARELLLRVRDTRPQTSLPRKDRILNMNTAFEAQTGPENACTYIVFDDVTTTGATLNAARTALQNRGYGSVMRLALAH